MQGRTVHRRAGVAQLALAFALTGLVAAPAAAQEAREEAPRSQVTEQGAVQIVVGERATVRLPAGGPPELLSVEPAPPGSAAPPKPGRGAFEDAPTGTVVISLERLSNGDVLMKLVSGLSKAFDYRARLLHAAEPGRWTAEPTSVCTVLPLLQNYEHWPRRPDTAGVLLSDFALRDTNEVVCPAPEAGR